MSLEATWVYYLQVHIVPFANAVVSIWNIMLPLKNPARIANGRIPPGEPLRVYYSSC